MGVSPKVKGSESAFGKLEVGAGGGEGEIREGAIVGSGWREQNSGEDGSTVPFLF